MNYFTLLFMTFAFSVSFAEEKPPLPEYTIYAVQDSINIDGLLEEPAWLQAPIIDEFSYPWLSLIHISEPTRPY